MMKLSDRIRKLRREQYPSQEAAARAAGVAMNTWSRWERGYAVPEVESLPKIAAALKITVSELMAEPG